MIEKGGHVPVTVLDRFTQQVVGNGNGVALKCGQFLMTYRELDQKSTELAQALRHFGVREGDYVPLFIDRSIELVTMMLAVIKAGAAYMPVDRSYPTERMQEMLALLHPSLVVYQGEDDSIPKLSGTSSRSLADLQAVRESAFIPTVNLDSESPLYVMFTSGSTGFPKAVVIPHRGVVSLVCEGRYVASGVDKVVLHMAPTSFDASTFEVWFPLLNGGTCVVVPEGVTSALNLQLHIREHGTSHRTGVLVYLSSQWK